MPRDSDPGARDRVNGAIGETIDSFNGPAKATEILARFMLNKWERMIKNDKPAARVIGREGARKLIADALGRYIGAEMDTDEPPQPELFPAHELPLVEKIGVHAVYVPSTKMYLPLHLIDAGQTIEAGRHLIRIGQDTTRRGQYVVQLGELRRRYREME